MTRLRHLIVLLVVLALLIVPMMSVYAEDSAPDEQTSAEVINGDTANAEDTGSIPQGMSLLMFLLGLGAITIVGLAGARGSLPGINGNNTGES